MKRRESKSQSSTNVNQHSSTQININQHQSTSININQHQSTQININQHQSTQINTDQHQSEEKEEGGKGDAGLVVNRDIGALSGAAATGKAKLLAEFGGETATVGDIGRRSREIRWRARSRTRQENILKVARILILDPEGTISPLAGQKVVLSLPAGHRALKVSESIALEGRTTRTADDLTQSLGGNTSNVPDLVQEICIERRLGQADCLSEEGELRETRATAVTSPVLIVLSVEPIGRCELLPDGEQLIDDVLIDGAEFWEKAGIGAVKHVAAVVWPLVSSSDRVVGGVKAVEGEMGHRARIDVKVTRPLCAARAAKVWRPQELEDVGLKLSDGMRIGLSP